MVLEAVQAEKYMVCSIPFYSICQGRSIKLFQKNPNNGYEDILFQRNP